MKGAHLGGPYLAFKAAAGAFPEGGNSGFTAVLDAATGAPAAILDDGGWLTEIRTAAASAVSARALARPDSRTLTILGGGFQAAFQVAALREALGIESVTVWSRSPETRDRFAAEHDAVARHGRRAVHGADIVICCTPSREPLVTSRCSRPAPTSSPWIRPPGQREWPMMCCSAPTCSSPTMCRSPSCRRTRPLAEATERAVDLGDVLTGRSVGRTSDEQITSLIMRSRHPGRRHGPTRDDRRNIVIDPATIDEAANRIEPHVLRTPLLTSDPLSERHGADIAIKCEHLQRTGSFKVRGSANVVHSLSPDLAAEGVITASSGNHGIGVATAAASRGFACTIYLPEGAAPSKMRRSAASARRSCSWRAPIPAVPRWRRGELPRSEASPTSPRTTTRASLPGRERSGKKSSRRRSPRCCGGVGRRWRTHLRYRDMDQGVVALDARDRCVSGERSGDGCVDRCRRDHHPALRADVL